MDRVKPLKRAGAVIVAALLTTLAVDAYNAFSGAMQASLLEDMRAGIAVTDAEIVANDDRVAMAATVQLAMFIVTAIAWIVWFRRAYRNLPDLGAHDLRYKRGWAVGAWFVPFLNLWRPKQIANDIWRASDPSAPAHQDAAWHKRPVPRLLAVWWLFWIVTSMLSNVAGRLIFDADTLEEHISSTNLMMWADGISALSAVPAILVVRRITRRQDDRIDHLSAGAPAGEHAYRALPLGEWIPPTAGSSGAGS